MKLADWWGAHCKRCNLGFQRQKSISKSKLKSESKLKSHQKMKRLLFAALNNQRLKNDALAKIFNIKQCHVKLQPITKCQYQCQSVCKWLSIDWKLLWILPNAKSFSSQWKSHQHLIEIHFHPIGEEKQNTSFD